MPWSTREVAKLAGTTVNTVRHYHSLGLLDEPKRLSNGYKQYRVSHLVSLVRVRRLVELGVPLTRIADVEGATPDALGDLDGDLEAGIDRLTRARADIAALTRTQAPLDTPRGFEPLAAGLSPAERSFVLLAARLVAPGALAEFSAMIGFEPAHVREAFHALHDDADEVRQRRVAHAIARSRANWRAFRATGAAGRALDEARRDLFNGAQLQVIAAASSLFDAECA